MTDQQSNPTSDLQRDFHKSRIRALIDILKKPSISDDDSAYLDKFVKTYCPEASKLLKNTLGPEALKKVYQGTQYKELDTDEILFTAKEASKFYILIIIGNNSHQYLLLS
jgi:hypothetical protein